MTERFNLERDNHISALEVSKELKENMQMLEITRKTDNENNSKTIKDKTEEIDKLNKEIKKKAMDAKKTMKECYSERKIRK